MAIASSIVAGGGEIGKMDVTITTLLSLSSLLLPVIGVMLGYSTIAGEAESGTLLVVLAYPVKRIEVLLGKFVGLSSVIFASALSGFGGAGVVISIATSTTEWKGYLVFMALAMLLGVLYVSLSLFFSAILKRRANRSRGRHLHILLGHDYWNNMAGDLCCHRRIDCRTLQRQGHIVSKLVLV